MNIWQAPIFVEVWSQIRKPERTKKTRVKSAAIKISITGFGTKSKIALKLIKEIIFLLAVVSYMLLDRLDFWIFKFSYCLWNNPNILQITTLSGSYSHDPPPKLLHWVVHILTTHLPNYCTEWFIFSRPTSQITALSGSYSHDPPPKLLHWVVQILTTTSQIIRMSRPSAHSTNLLQTLSGPACITHHLITYNEWARLYNLPPKYFIKRAKFHNPSPNY